MIFMRLTSMHAMKRSPSERASIAFMLFEE